VPTLRSSSSMRASPRRTSGSRSSFSSAKVEGGGPPAGASRWLTAAGGLAQQLEDLRLGQITQRLEHQHDVVAERLDVLLVEGGDDALHDPAAAAGEAEIAALIPVVDPTGDRVHRGAGQDADLRGQVAQRLELGVAALRVVEQEVETGLDAVEAVGVTHVVGAARRVGLRGRVRVEGGHIDTSIRALVRRGACSASGSASGSEGRSLPIIDMSACSGSGRPGSSRCQ
jgi:hypothetical protein